MNAAHVVVMAALVAVSSAAVAAPAVGLAYEAPPGCPSQAEFVAGVAARGADFDAAEATQGRHIMVVTLRREIDGFAGAFQMRDGRDATTKREVRGPSCGEVADAMAVVTAIALHADGPGASSASATTAQPHATASDGPAPPRATPPVEPAPPPPDVRLRGSTRAFPPRTESVQIHAGALRFDLRRSATFYVGAATGVIPSVLLPRYDLSAVAANFVTTPDGEQRISGLVLALHVGVLGKGTYQSPDTKTDATALTFGIDLCQSPIYDTKGLVLLFCGGYGGGLMMLKTRGLDGAQMQSKNSGFGEVSLSAELQYHLAFGFHVGVKVGGGLTIGQMTAERADGSRIFASSPWSADVLLGVGFRF